MARFKLPDGVSGTLAFSACPQLTIVDSAGRNLHADHPLQPFSILPAAGRREGGLAWYSKQPLEDVAMGLGEKAAPINLAHRRWELRATNASHYSADASDPLYKKLDFLLLLPNPLDPVRKRFKAARDSLSILRTAVEARALICWPSCSLFRSQTRTPRPRERSASTRPATVPPSGTLATRSTTRPASSSLSLRQRARSISFSRGARRASR